MLLLLVLIKDRETTEADRAHPWECKSITTTKKMQQIRKLES